MQRLRLLFFTSLLLAARPAVGLAQTGGTTPGALWLSVDPVMRDLVVIGVGTGADLAANMVRIILEDSTARRRWLRPTTPEASLDSALLRSIGTLQSAQRTPRAVAAIITQLYEDPSNTCIPFTTIFPAAIARLTGTSASVMEPLLADARRSALATCGRR